MDFWACELCGSWTWIGVITSSMILAASSLLSGCKCLQISMVVLGLAWPRSFETVITGTSVLNISETAMCLKSKPCSNSPCIWRSQASVLVFITKVRLNRWSQLRVVRVCQCPLWTFGDRTFISKADVFWHFLISLSFQREGGRQTCITSVENVKFEPPRLKVA